MPGEAATEPEEGASAGAREVVLLEVLLEAEGAAVLLGGSRMPNRQSLATWEE